MRGSHLVSALAIVGCGDPIAGADYRGEPELVVRGQIAALPGISIPSQVRLGVVWISGATGTSTAARTGPHTLFAAATDTTPAGLGAFTLELFEPPAEAATQDGIAVGAIVAFEDRDGDQSLACTTWPPRDCPETVLGASPNALVLYARERRDQAIFDRLRVNRLGILQRDTGVRPPAGFSMAALEPVSDSLQCEVTCSCIVEAALCATPQPEAHPRLFSCSASDCRDLSPLQAPRRVRPFAHEDGVEVRMVGDLASQPPASWNLVLPVVML